MSQLLALQNAVTTRLQSCAELTTALPQPVTFLKEDKAELLTAISETLGKLGLLVLIGQPEFAQSSEVSAPEPGAVSAPAAYNIEMFIAIGENTIINRGAGGTGLKCVAAAELIVRRLQNFALAGFMPLRVSAAVPIPDKKRQVYQVALETSTILSPL
jgi:hypothetical protein